jgi:hypothetical protein
MRLPQPILRLRSPCCVQCREMMEGVVRVVVGITATEQVQMLVYSLTALLQICSRTFASVVVFRTRFIVLMQFRRLG